MGRFIEGDVALLEGIIHSSVHESQSIRSITEQNTSYLTFFFYFYSSNISFTTTSSAPTPPETPTSQ